MTDCPQCGKKLRGEKALVKHIWTEMYEEEARKRDDFFKKMQGVDKTRGTG